MVEIISVVLVILGVLLGSFTSRNRRAEKVERHNPKGSPVLYRCLIDITFNVFSGTPKGKAPDLYSPTLRPKRLL
jgi:hypothetical protein